MTNTAESQTFESTTPLLRPDQVDEMQEEKARLRGMLDGPPHVRRQVQDVGAMIQTLRRLETSLETQTPTPYRTDQIDDARKRERQLREDFTEGMPTQAEMRRNPPGAVDKHRAWEARNKKKILEWKNIRRRLQSSGHLGEDRSARDIANIEMFRPAGGSQEMSMDGAQIEGKQYHLPPPGAGPTVVITDAHKRVLEKHSPDLLLKLALMDNDQRAELVESCDRLIEMEEPNDWIVLRQQAKDLGINTKGMNREEVEAAIASVQPKE